MELNVSLMGAEVYKILKDKVVKGEYLPEERLYEEEIASTLEVSRTPVREAFKKLQRDGLLEKVPSGGVKVAGLSEKKIIDIYDVRLILETKIIEHVSINYSKNDLIELAKVANEFEEFLNGGENKEEDVVRSIELAGDFHQIIMEIYGNKEALDILKKFQAQIDRYAYLALKKGDRLSIAAREHLKIYKLIKGKDSQKAKEEMKRHLEEARRVTMERIKNLYQI